MPKVKFDQWRKEAGFYTDTPSKSSCHSFVIECDGNEFRLRNAAGNPEAGEMPVPIDAPTKKQS